MVNFKRQKLNLQFIVCKQKSCVHLIFIVVMREALRPWVPFLEPFGMSPQPLGLKVDILPLACSAISGATYNLEHVSTQIILFVI